MAAISHVAALGQPLEDDASVRRNEVRPTGRIMRCSQTTGAQSGLTASVTQCEHARSVSNKTTTSRGKKHAFCCDGLKVLHTGAPHESMVKIGGA